MSATFPSPQPDWSAATGVPTPRQPVIVDLTAERMARGGKAPNRVEGEWMAIDGLTANAVWDWRICEARATERACAEAAGVTISCWKQMENLSGKSVVWAPDAYKVLTYIMASGGPAFDLGGPPA